MGIEKAFYHNLVKNMFSDPCEVKFWDGEIKQYGEGKALFRITFNEPLDRLQIMNDPSIAFGEGYMFGKIEIDGSIQKVIESIYKNKSSFLNDNKYYMNLVKKVSNSIQKNQEDVKYHYDIGNDFYRLWLDETMTYSCAYFKSQDDTLAQAQKNKIELILHKLKLYPGQTLLDIGCGWGELILTAARDYQVKSLGITLSSEQYLKVKDRIKDEKLQNLVEVLQIDFRELHDRSYDRVVSVGMIEHVGKENIGLYFSSIDSFLNNDGMSLLHCITGNSEDGTNSWTNKYIFPGGYIPAIHFLTENISEYGFKLIHLESLRKHYIKTLEIWAQNFEKALPQIRQMKDEVFIRMWRLYLNSSAASFSSGNLDVHQMLFTR
ncbi:MAG: class I SAM-dependent methyltransferase [Saccharofermentanales bacterium]